MVGTRPCKIRSDTRVGILLTEARQRQGCSVAAAAASLRIPERQLQALEAGDLSVFSAEVYARGAFAKYAEFLGVHAQATQHAFQRVLSEVRENVPLKVHRPRPWMAARLTPAVVLAAALTAVAVLIGSYMGWQVMSFLRLPDLELTGPTVGIAENGRVIVRGRAATDAVVMVNRGQALMNTAGEFEEELALHPGINVIEVAATNAAGRTRTITKDILMPGG